MTERDGVIAGLAGVIGVMTGSGLPSIGPPLFRGHLTMALDSFTSYRFTLGDEVVVLTPAEVMAALKGRE